MMRLLVLFSCIFIFLVSATAVTQATDKTTFFDISYCVGALTVTKTYIRARLSLDPEPRDYLREVTVTRGSVRTPFAIKDRSASEVALEHDVFDLASWISQFKGKRVLDAASGGYGNFVRYLRMHGIDAYGIDVLVDDDLHIPWLTRQDISETNFPDAYFDEIISTLGPIEYESIDSHLNNLPFHILVKAASDSETFYRKTFREWARILKPGGRVQLAPVWFPHFKHVIEEGGFFDVEEDVYPILILKRNNRLFMP